MDFEYELPPDVDDSKEDRLRELHERRQELIKADWDGDTRDKLEEVNDKITAVLIE